MSYRITNRRKIDPSALGETARAQLAVVVSRVFADELTLAEAADACAAWEVHDEAGHVFDLWADDGWMDGVVFQAGGTELAPIALIQHHFTATDPGDASADGIATALGEAPRG